ncbi:hypothetical protein J6590_105279 [Homalodisca vitripennis]|nr:hypothetical protein J6590_105279 [Homalodisca vitripennis]
MQLYSILDSPSARWGLRPQAPKVNACKFGDKRNSTFPGGLKTPASTSRSGLEFVYPISESVSQLHMRLYIYGTRLRLAGGYAPRPPFGCWLNSGISVVRRQTLAATFGLARNELGRKVCTGQLS